MKIIAESETEEKLIQSLCDIALKAGGIGNLQHVETILNSMERATDDGISKD